MLVWQLLPDVVTLKIVRTTHPKWSRRFLLLVLHPHADVVELPETLPLEEIRPSCLQKKSQIGTPYRGLNSTVFPLEDCVYVRPPSVPHRHISGIVQLDLPLLLVEPPV